MLLRGEPVVDGQAQTCGSSPLWVSGMIPCRGQNSCPWDQHMVPCRQRVPTCGAERMFDDILWSVQRGQTLLHYVAEPAEDGRGIRQTPHSHMDDLPVLIQQRLATRMRRVIDDPQMRRASVLLPLYRDAGETYAIFTRRTDTVEHHKGQISLPGGAEDEGDAGPLDTALRETEEELGIPRAQVRILGTLDDVYTVVSGFVITPFVGLVPHPVPLRINPQEIAEILSVPLSTFRDPANLRVEEREREGERILVYFYYHGQHEIWGATGRIMKGFIDIVFGEERS